VGSRDKPGGDLKRSLPEAEALSFVHAYCKHLVQAYMTLDALSKRIVYGFSVNIASLPCLLKTFQIFRLGFKEPKGPL